VVICLQQGANDLHMVQLMALPLSGASLHRLSWKKRPINVIAYNYIYAVCHVNVILVSITNTKFLHEIITM